MCENCSHTFAFATPQEKESGAVRYCNLGGQMPTLSPKTSFIYWLCALVRHPVWSRQCQFHSHPTVQCHHTSMRSWLMEETQAEDSSPGNSNSHTNLLVVQKVSGEVHTGFL